MRVKFRIENQEVELFGDEPMQITEVMRLFDQVDAQVGQFTQTFTIPASDSNNAIMKHWWEVDVIGGWNPSIGVPGIIEVGSGFEYEGIVALEGVEMQDGQPTFYTVQFFGDVRSLSKLWEEKTLQEISYTLSSVLNYNSILNSQDPGTPVHWPLIAYGRPWVITNLTNPASAKNAINTTTGVIRQSELRPAWRVKNLLVELFNDVGISVAGGFMTDTEQDNLYVLGMNEPGSIQRVVPPSSVVAAPKGYPSLQVANVDFTAAVYDPDGSWDLVNDWYTAPFSGVYTFEFNWIRTTGAAINLLQVLDVEIVGQPPLVGFSNQIITSPLFTAGSPSVVSVTRTVGLNQNDRVRFPFKVNLAGTTPGNLITCEFIEVTVKAAFVDAIGSTLQPQQTLPPMQVTEFIQGIMTTFNLIAIPTGPTSWNLDYFDVWIGQGKSINLDPYVDRSKVMAKPKKIPAMFSFKHKMGEDAASVLFKQASGREFGSMEYKPEADFPGPEVKVSTPFTIIPPSVLTEIETGNPTPYRIPQFISVDGNPVKNELTLYYKGPTKGAVIFMQNNSQVPTLFPKYGPVSFYTDNIATVNTESLSFTLENPYPGGGASAPAQTLFQRLWQETIENFFGFNTRRVYVSGWMDEGVWQPIKNNDTFYFDDTPYKAEERTYNPVTGEFTMTLITFFPERIRRVVSTNPVGDVGTDPATLTRGDIQRLNLTQVGTALVPATRIQVSEIPPMRTQALVSNIQSIRGTQRLQISASFNNSLVAIPATGQMFYQPVAVGGNRFTLNISKTDVGGGFFPVVPIGGAPGWVVTLTQEDTNYKAENVILDITDSGTYWSLNVTQTFIDGTRGDDPVTILLYNY